MSTVASIERPLITTTGSGRHPWIVCPVCHYPYVQLLEMHLDNAGDIAISGRCEAEDHAFEICFEFHKGNTSVFCRVGVPEK